MVWIECERVGQYGRMVNRQKKGKLCDNSRQTGNEPLAALGKKDSLFSKYIHYTTFTKDTFDSSFCTSSKG